MRYPGDVEASVLSGGILVSSQWFQDPSNPSILFLSISIPLSIPLLFPFYSSSIPLSFILFSTLYFNDFRRYLADQIT